MLGKRGDGGNVNVNKPSVIQRAKLAIDVFRNGFSRPHDYKAARTPFLWPAWREGVPQWHLIDLQSYIQEGFNTNSLIYSALMYKVRAASIAPLWTKRYSNSAIATRL